MTARHIFIPWSEEEATRAARIAAARWQVEYEEKTRSLNPSFIARICRICVAPNRFDLDIEILTGEPPREIALSIGPRYTTKAVLKHRDEHLIPLLADAMPEVKQKNIEAALSLPFPYKESEVSQLDWCQVQFLAIRAKYPDDPKFQLKALTEIRNTILAISRAPKQVALPPPETKVGDDRIADFSEHEQNLDDAFAKSRVRRHEEEEDGEVVEPRT